MDVQMTVFLKRSLPSASATRPPLPPAPKGREELQGPSCTQTPVCWS